MSRKNKTKPASKGSKLGWKDTSTVTSEGTSLGKRLPTNTVPALARVGMVVMPLNSGKYAQIIHVLEDFCIVRNEDGSTDALRWGEVEIGVVSPDPAGDVVSPVPADAIGLMTITFRIWTLWDDLKAEQAKFGREFENDSSFKEAVESLDDAAVALWTNPLMNLIRLGRTS